MNAFWEYTGDTANELPNYLGELDSGFAPRSAVNFCASSTSSVMTTTQVELQSLSKRRDLLRLQRCNYVAMSSLRQMDTVQITADFVTTGAIQLKMNLIVPDALLTWKAVTTYFWIKMQALNLL